MQYKEKILELIFSTDSEALNTWIASHPELERVDIYRELKEIVQNVMAESEDSEQAEALCAELEKKTNDYEDACLDAQVASLKVDLAETQLDKAVEEMDKTYQGMKEYIRECIETNAPNAAEMKEMAAQLIASEKEHGLYDIDNWLWFKE
jgi:RNA processing factor Prp31